MRTVAAVVAAMLAASCSGSNSDICSPVPDLSADVGADAVEKMAARDPTWLRTRAVNCLHRWGYRLAASDDDGTTVAKAVMQACDGAVTEHADAFANRAADELYQDMPASDATARDRIDFVEQGRTQTLDELEREAIFRVQQARAGKCRA